MSEAPAASCAQDRIVKIEEMRLGAVLVLFLVSSVVAFKRFRSGIPVNAVLSAPYTPFHSGFMFFEKSSSVSDYSLNVDVVPALARDSADSGVNVVWVAGDLCSIRCALLSLSLFPCSYPRSFWP